MTESKSSVELNEVVTDEIKIALPSTITTLPNNAPPYTSNFEGMFKDVKVDAELGITTWDVSHVTNMSHTFDGSEIPDNITKWNVGNVKDFTYTFNGASLFNQDLSGWDVRTHPVEPDGFSEGAISWTLPKPLWGQYVGKITTKIISATEVDKSPRENAYLFLLDVRDDNLKVLEGLTKEDFTVNLIANEELVVDIYNVTFDKEIKQYRIYTTISGDYSGEVNVNVKGHVSTNTVEIDYIKKLTRILDLDKSKVLYNVYDDFSDGLTTLTLKLYDTDGVVFEPGFYNLDDFVFVDDNNASDIKVIKFKDAVPGQYDILIKSDLTKELLLTTFVREEMLSNKYIIDTNVPMSISLSVGDYVNDGEVSTVTINVTVVGVANTNVYGLTKEDFILQQQPNNQDPGTLEIVEVIENEDHTYQLVLSADKDYKGLLGIDSGSAKTELEFYVNVDYIAIPKKEIDYFNSQLISGEIINPEVSEFELLLKVVDQFGNPYTELTKDQLTLEEVNGLAEITVHSIELTDEEEWIVKGVYNNHKSVTITANIDNKDIGGSVLLTHPLEVLDVSIVDIVGNKITTVPDDARYLTIYVTAKDINNKFVPDLNKDNFSLTFNDVEDILTVKSVDEIKRNGEIIYELQTIAKDHLLGEVFVYVDGIKSNTFIQIDYLSVIQDSIDRNLSKILSGEYINEDNTSAKLVVNCLNKDGVVVEDLVKNSFKLRNYDTDSEMFITKVERVEDNYVLYFEDFGISDLNLEVYVNELRIAERYVLIYPRPRKLPVKTIATFDRFVVSEKEREISIIVEAFDDTKQLVSELLEGDLNALLVPEQEGVTLEITEFKKLTSPASVAGKYNFIIKGNTAFTGKIGFYGEEVTIVIPTEELNYDPVNIVDLKNTKFLSGSYDPYNNSIVRMKIKVVDWDGNPIRRLKRSDFVIEELSATENIFIISSIESEMPGEYNLTVAFDEVRKAVFVAHVLGVPTANTLVLEHPVLLKTTVEVEMSFIEYVEAGGKRYIETLVKPKNHLGEIIEDLPKGIFISYYPVDTFDRAFDITRFTTVYDADGAFEGYNVQLYRPSPFKGLLGVSVDGIRPPEAIEVDYDPVVIDPEKPTDEDVERVVTAVTKNVIKPGEFKNVYTCNPARVNAIVDLSIFSDIEDKKRFDNKVNIYLSENGGLSKPDDRYLIMKGVPISDFEIGKIIVGSGQSLYIESACTININVRVSGLEEMSDIVATSGLISTITVNNVGINEVYRLDYPLAVYTSININVVNNTNKDDEVTLWIIDNRDIETVNEEHRLMDKIDRRVVKKKTMFTLKNITLGPNERIYVNSNALGLVVNVTGIVINANF